MYELFLSRLAAIGQNDGAGILTAEELSAWPQKEVAAYNRIRLLKKAAPAKTVECPGCEDACLMPVHVFPAQDAKPARIFVACDRRDDTGRVPIEPATLEQWQIDIPRFASLLASALGTGHSPDEIIPKQVFYIGSLTINGKRRSAFFAANEEVLNSAPEADLFRRYGQPFFLVASGLNGPQKIYDRPIISLRHLLMISDSNSISIDMMMLEQLISEEDNRNTAPGTTKTGGNIFRKDGQKWVMRFKGSMDIFCNDNKGFLYISQLLGSPAREIHSQLLLTSTDGGNLEKMVGSGGVVSPSEIGEIQQGGRLKNPILDEQARKEYQERINALRQLIDAAEKDHNLVKKGKYQHEYELLRKEIVAASGLGGQARNIADDAEKARKSVSEAVRRSLKIIQKEHPELYLHLKNTINLGEYCSYTPDEEIEWELNRR